MQQTTETSAAKAAYLSKIKALETLKPKMKVVPDFPPDLDWLNTPANKPLSIHKELKGKIVVVDFWSSCCINCIHVLAELKDLEETFKGEKGIAFIGCHSAKFDNEKQTRLLR